MLKAYKYRIYPNKEQSILIDETIDLCRLVYNLALETKIYVWQSYRIKLTSFDLCYQLIDLKNEYKWLKKADSQSLQNSVKTVDIAFDNFFNGKGYPKFKKKKNSGSFQCPNNLRKIDWDKSILTIPKIKNIPIVLSRKFNGEIKTITISKTPTNKYFASVLVKDNKECIVAKSPKIAIGIDLGIKHFAIVSDNTKIDNHKFIYKNIKKLKVFQKKASRKKKGSNNRKKANLKVALLHEKIANQRKDFLHKLSTKFICDNQTDTICVESLAIKNMVKNHKLSQSINDASWAEFIRQLEYKGKWYGKNIIKIDSWYASSKICSNCGHKYDELNLSERVWTCSKCNETHDRDINAAKNIKFMGMSAVGSRKEPEELSTLVGAANQENIQNKSILLPTCT